MGGVACRERLVTAWNRLFGIKAAATMRMKFFGAAGQECPGIAAQHDRWQMPHKFDALRE